MIETQRASAKHFAIVLSVVFSAEFTIMYVLPWVLPRSVPWWFETLVDAMLLTSVTAPALWFLTVRPWREVAQSRRELLAFTIREREEERRKIARNLHDELGQSITSILVCLRHLDGGASSQSVAESAQTIRSIATQMIEDVRRLSRGLRPAVLDDFGLAVALGRLTDDMAHTSGIVVDLHASSIKDQRFSHELEIEIFRIVQEALTNIVRHAKTDRAQVRVTVDDRSLEVIVRDQGGGFDTHAQESARTTLHFGLAGMRERAALLGGSLQLRSSLGQGTSVCVRVPLSERADGQDSHPAGR